MSEQPIYYPIFLDLRGKRCLVVGGGKVAQRKVESLLDAGAEVLVVAPEMVDMPAGAILKPRGFEPADVDDVWLVIAATNNRAVNTAVADAAAARHLWVNVVDVPEECTAIMPALVRRGALCIAVSTGGASPTFARKLKERLEAEFGPEYGELLAMLADLRRAWEPRFKAANIPDAVRKRSWDTVLDLPLLERLRNGDRDGAEQEAAAVLAAVLTAGR